MALQDGTEKGSRLNKDVAVSIAFDPVGQWVWTVLMVFLSRAEWSSPVGLRGAT